VGGEVYEFGQEDMVRGSGYISSQCRDNSEIELGTMYTAAGFRCRGERLLTEYWLSGFHSRKHKLLMERI